MDPCWPGEGQRGEVSQTSLALAEVRRGKALKAEMVLKGQMMTDSWAAIKKQRTVICIHILVDTISIPVTSQAREATAVGALDALDQRPFSPRNLLNKMSTTLFRVFSSSQKV